MAESIQRDNPEVSHETADVDVRGILRFGGALAIVAVVIQIALYWLLLYYDRREARRDTPVTSAQSKEEPPTEPRLRVAPRADLLEMRRAEDQVLNSYGWVDREKNIARVPIERGMEIIVKRGLPMRKQAPQTTKESAGARTTAEGGQNR
jgi:hypothetical protein